MSSPIPNPLKFAYYNFKHPFDSTLKETLLRYQDELKTGQKGPASDFLEKLSNHFPQHFEQLLASSIAKYTKFLSGSTLTFLRAIDPRLSSIDAAVESGNQQESTLQIANLNEAIVDALLKEGNIQFVDTDTFMKKMVSWRK